MLPLPKWSGWLGALAAIFATLNSADVVAVLPHNVSAVIASVGAVLALFAHSATGSGGKPQ